MAEQSEEELYEAVMAAFKMGALRRVLWAGVGAGGGIAMTAASLGGYLPDTLAVPWTPPLLGAFGVLCLALSTLGAVKYDGNGRLEELLEERANRELGDEVSD